MEDTPEVNCELIDLTRMSLDELRHTTDESVVASVHTVLLASADPVSREARMNSTGPSDCEGNLVPDEPEPRLVPLITC